MKQLSEEKRLRLNELEKLTYEVEIGNTHKVRKMKGNLLNSAFLLGELSDSRRMMIVRQVENERKPVRVENKAFEDVLMSILVGYIHSKRCCLPFNEEFACRRLSLCSAVLSRRNSQDGERPCDCELPDTATCSGGIIDY